MCVLLQTSHAFFRKNSSCLSSCHPAPHELQTFRRHSGGLHAPPQSYLVESVCRQTYLRASMSKVPAATAQEAFGATTRALKIHPRWLNQILQGTKRIEIRSKPCPHKGWISLAATGVLEIQGRAYISGSHRLSAAEREEHAAALEVTGRAAKTL